MIKLILKRTKEAFNRFYSFFLFVKKRKIIKIFFSCISFFCLTWKPLVLVPPGKENEDNNKNKITTLKIMAGGCSKCSLYWFVLIGSYIGRLPYREATRAHFEQPTTHSRAPAKS